MNALNKNGGREQEQRAKKRGGISFYGSPIQSSFHSVDATYAYARLVIQVVRHNGRKHVMTG